MATKPSVVLDTTILVSAFLTPTGVAAEALSRAVADYVLVLSPDILAETSRKLLTKRKIRKKYRYSDDSVREYIQQLIVLAGLIVHDPPPLRGIVRDPEDDMIVACAAAISADYIVSRDKDLLVLGAYERTTIATPRLFLDALAARR